MEESKTAAKKMKIKKTASLNIILVSALFAIFFLSQNIFAQSYFDETYILFNDTYSTVELEFTEDVLSHEFYVTLPYGNVILQASIS